MKNKYISEIVRKFFNENYSEETEKNIQQWLIEEENNVEKEQSVHEYWDSLHRDTDESVYSSLNMVKEKLGIVQPKKQKFLRRQFLRIAAILVPVFLIIGGGYIYVNKTITTNLVKVTVPNGERKQINLPDGSVVWLNAGSSIEYAENFEDEIRKLNLTGEAFFSVVKNEMKPFVVVTKQVSVKVLGTKFTVSAYSNEENTITTLKQGKIQVETSSRKIYLLHPHQQLSYNNITSEIDTLTVNTEDIGAWITGDLIFEYKSMKEIFQSLERSFNVTIKADKSILSNKDKFSVKFVNNEDIDQVLTILKNIGGFTYKIKGKTIAIKANE